MLNHFSPTQNYLINNNVHGENKDVLEGFIISIDYLYCNCFRFCLFFVYLFFVAFFNKLVISISDNKATIRIGNVLNIQVSKSP